MPYGYGLIGKYLLKELEKEGYKVEFIIDRKLAGTEVNGIKILSIEDVKTSQQKLHASFLFIIIMLILLN